MLYEIIIILCHWMGWGRRSCLQQVYLSDRKGFVAHPPRRSGGGRILTYFKKRR